MVPRKGFAWVTQKLRGEVTVPLIAVNRINTPAIAEEVLASGAADMVSMARPFLADPEIMLKAIEERPDEINTCIACNQACLDHTLAYRRSRGRPCRTSLFCYSGKSGSRDTFI